MHQLMLSSLLGLSLTGAMLGGVASGDVPGVSALKQAVGGLVGDTPPDEAAAALQQAVRSGASDAATVRAAPAATAPPAVVPAQGQVIAEKMRSFLAERVAP